MPADRDVEALWTLRALVREERSRRPPSRALADLAARLRGCAQRRDPAPRHGPRRGARARTRSSATSTGSRTSSSVTLRHEGNAAGAEDVLAWQTGYPSAVSLAGGHPRASPGELSAAAMLARGDADAALVVGSDPLEHLPAAAAERLRAIPVVTVDARDDDDRRARRASRSRRPRRACTGAGVAHRLDGVPVPLRAVLESDAAGRRGGARGDRRALARAGGTA